MLSIVFTTDTRAQQANTELATFVQANIDSVYKTDKVPGIFVGILNNGNRSWYNAGFTRPDEQLPFDSATVFEIGSITKTFTAYVLTAVLTEKQIPDTGKIISYLPDSVQQNNQLGNISFQSLMNHTSGLPRLPGNMKLDNKVPYDDYTAAKLFAFLKTCTPKPDEKSNYSNLGAGLAGVLAVRISGKAYEQLINQYFFEPATSGGNHKFSQGYFATNEKAEFWNMDVLAPAGGLKYTAEQMINYLQLMCFPESENARFVVDKLTTQTIAINRQVGVGLGWHLLKFNNQPPVYWHNGGTYGFSTFCAFVKNKSKAVIVVINQFNKNAPCDALGIKIINRMIRED